MIVWGLFDSGNGSYFKAAQKMEGIELYSVGVDIENKNDHFINLDLADYSHIFTGENNIIRTLDKLPKPDLIIASPPCESWSNASSMWGGNACWKQERGDSLFEPQVPLSKFTIRDYQDYEIDGRGMKAEKQLLTRINGELCIFNTVQIIKHYQPEAYIIENPAYGRIWEYVDKVLGFKIPHDNLTYYNNYDYPIQKPTKFKSNIDLKLDDTVTKAEVNWEKFGKGYNERSNIPGKLVETIFNTCRSNLLETV